MSDQEVLLEIEDIKFERRHVRMLVLGKAFMLFAFQAILISGVLHSCVYYAKMYGAYAGEGMMAYVGCSKPTVYFSCFLACFIVHMSTQPSLDAVFERVMYLYAHPERFENTFIPMMLCLMKFTMDISIQLSNVFCELSLNDELWIAMCFSAMACVSDVDKRYFDLMESNGLHF